MMVEPADPLEGGELDVLDAPPGAAVVNDFGLEEADHGFGQGVVVRVSATADRGFDARVEEPLGVADREILDAAIAVMHEPRFAIANALANGLLERIQRQVAPQGARDAPADDPPGKDVDDERDIDEAAPRGDVGEIRHPELIGRVAVKLRATKSSGRGAASSGIVVRVRRPRDDPRWAHRAHEPLHRASGDAHALSDQLAPALARAV